MTLTTFECCDEDNALLGSKIALSYPDNHGITSCRESIFMFISKSTFSSKTLQLTCFRLRYVLMLQTHAVIEGIILSVMSYYSCFNATCRRFFSSRTAALSHEVFLFEDDASAIANTESKNTEDAVAGYSAAFAFDNSGFFWTI